MIKEVTEVRAAEIGLDEYLKSRELNTVVGSIANTRANLALEFLTILVNHRRASEEVGRDA